MDFNVKQMGASGENIERDTEILQKAIDRCSEEGGCVVVPENFVLMIHGIWLRSNVELILEKNSMLKGSGDEDRYIFRPGPFERIKNNTPIRALLFAKNAQNIKISGCGVIDGNYEKFILPKQEEAKHLKFYKYPRPMTIYLENCKDINLASISIQNAPFWTIHLVGCNRTYIENIKIQNEMRMPNTDGIDIDRCKDTFIRGCDILTGDDAICPKCTEETSRYGDCINLFVEKCHLISASSAIKFGSSSFGNFSNCLFQNIKIDKSNRGLALQLRDTHDAENIIFKDIEISTQRFSKEWWGCGEPIYITCCTREEGALLGRIQNVFFENITCLAENGVFIYTDIPDNIRNIYFRNIILKFARNLEYGDNCYDLRPWKGQEKIFEKFAPVYMMNANNISFENMQIQDDEQVLETRKYILKQCSNIKDM
jgi:hypothetical protein